MKQIHISLFAVMLFAANLVQAQWSTSGSNIYYNSGKVGIGTTNPQERLHINGNHVMMGYNDGYLGAVTSIFFRNEYLSTTMNLAAIKAIADNTMYTMGLGFFTGAGTEASERMRISSEGNVGIGTTNPQSKLEVNGEIKTKKVKVTLSGWPDYVFENDYVLKPLSEIEAYIKQNKHLPEVPSAEDVAKNDLDLGEMNKILLMKVEELTLYLIELKKENQSIKKANETILERLEKVDPQ